MRLEIGYRMHFRYSEAVTESQNEVRVRPRDDDCQRVVSYRLTSQPPVPVLQTVDYWGTVVEHLGVRTPHSELELVAEASVETMPRVAPPGDTAVDAVRGDEFREAHFEMLAPSPHVQWRPDDVVARRSGAAAAGERTVGDAVTAVIDDVRATLAYRPGATEIGVSLAELVEGGAGVCQDYAHLAIGMLRSVGIPARYVSGYLFAADETELGGEAPDVVSVQTHAWIEAAVPGFGWWALDPTNGGSVGERHVVIGCGRDYGDVAPVRGAFVGSATADVDAEVVIGKSPAADAEVYAPRHPRRPHPQQPDAARWGHQQQQQQ